MERQLQRGYSLDCFYDCTYEMHDLTNEEMEWLLIVTSQYKCRVN